MSSPELVGILQKAIDNDSRSTNTTNSFTDTEDCSITSAEPGSTFKTEQLNKLTLELFMNKNNYKKYLSKTDTRKYEEYQTHLSNINKYKRSLLQITDNLLNDPNMQITTEVNDIFEIYIKTLIDHLQRKEFEDTSNESDYTKNNDDEDMLFGKMDDHTGSITPMHSFWGKDRVVKKPQTQLEYDMQLFSRGRTK